MKRDKTVIEEDRQEKFKIIYEKYCRLMKYIAVKNLDNETLAEDAVQNAFIKIFRFIDKIEETDSPKTRAFVVLITENCCKDIRKIENRQRLRQLKLVNEGFKNREFDFQVIEEKEIAKQIDEIPNQYKTVLMLKFYYDLSYDEIGEILGITNQNVRKRLQRARKCAIEILKNGAEDFEDK